MNKLEAFEYVQRTQGLLKAAATRTFVVPEQSNPFGGTATWLRELGIDKENGETLTDEEYTRLLVELIDIEIAAAHMLRNADVLPLLRIVTSDPSGPSKDPRALDYNRLEPVDYIEEMSKPKIHEWPDGSLQRVSGMEYIAHSAPYDAADGHKTEDWTKSGTEGFVQAPDGQVQHYGAASALLARLLEGRAAGLV